MTKPLQRGFADPVTDAQTCFRAVLDALARPGTIRRVPALAPPPTLAPSTAAVLLTLLDHDTPTWLDPKFSDAAAWLIFHCGVTLVAPAQAVFAIAPDMPALNGLSAGTDAAPEESTTLILQVTGLGRGRTLRLAGPGLRAPCDFAVEGLPDDFVARWNTNHAAFPRGVDLVLCAGDHVAALPRTVEIS